MYSVVQTIRYRHPFIWNLIESGNAIFFGFRYRHNLKRIPKLLLEFSNNDVSYSLVNKDDASELAYFFHKQPNDAFKYFRPHEYDEASIRKLIENPSFIMIIARIDSKIVGYSFLRCFANGKSFRGKIVDVAFRGRGLAKNFGLLTTEIASNMGLRLFGSISKSNISSMASSKSSNEIRIIKELPDDYLLIQYLPKQTCSK